MALWRSTLRQGAKMDPLMEPLHYLALDTLLSNRRLRHDTRQMAWIILRDAKLSRYSTQELERLLLVTRTAYRKANAIKKARNAGTPDSRESRWESELEAKWSGHTEGKQHLLPTFPRRDLSVSRRWVILEVCNMGIIAVLSSLVLSSLMAAPLRRLQSHLEAEAVVFFVNFMTMAILPAAFALRVSIPRTGGIRWRTVSNWILHLGALICCTLWAWHIGLATKGG